MKNSVNVLISSAGRRVELLEAFRRSLASLNIGGRIFTTDAGTLSSASRFADRHFKVPKIDDVSFIPEMLRLCSREAIDLVIPTLDTELGKYSENIEKFEAIGTRIVVSSKETIDISGDKLKTNAWLVDMSIRTPKIHDFSLEGEVVYRGESLIAKPVRGSMSKDVHHIDSEQDLKGFISAHDLNEYIIQDRIRGPEYTVSIFLDENGNCLAEVPRQRLEVRGGEVSKGLTVRDGLLEGIAREVGEALPGARGPMNVQIIKDSQSDHFYVIEINARFGGGDPLAWAAGADAPMWLIKESLGLPLEGRPKWEENMLMLRYDQSVFVHQDD